MRTREIFVSNNHLLSALTSYLKSLSLIYDNEEVTGFDGGIGYALVTKEKTDAQEP